MHRTVHHSSTKWKHGNRISKLGISNFLFHKVYYSNAIKVIYKECVKKQSPSKVFPLMLNDQKVPDISKSSCVCVLVCMKTDK